MNKRLMLELVSCPAGLALMRKHRLVTMLEFLGPGSAIQPKYWLANLPTKIISYIHWIPDRFKSADCQKLIQDNSVCIEVLRNFLVEFHPSLVSMKKTGFQCV